MLYAYPSLPDPRYFYSSPHLNVTVLRSDILFAYWKGPQTLATIHDGGEQLLGFQREGHFAKILNSNVDVTGSWDEAVPYAVSYFFPAMAAEGLRYFAWVLPRDGGAMASAQRVTSEEVAIQQFDNASQAVRWLYGLPGNGALRLFSGY